VIAFVIWLHLFGNIVGKIEKIKDLHIMCIVKTITKQEKTTSKRGRFLYIEF
jgi:hypothetical protein